MSQRLIDLQIVNCDTRLVRCLTAFYADHHHVPHSAIAAIDNPDLAVKTWQLAQSWLGAGAHWGQSQSGVSMDCVGSAIALAVDTGVLNIPFAVKQRMSGMVGRSGELQLDPVMLNRRLQAFLMYTVMKCTTEGYCVIPIPDPVCVHPLDIFITPYTWTVQGTLMYPHAMICVNGEKFLTANPGEQQLQLIDVAEGVHLADKISMPDNPEAVSFALRFYKYVPDKTYEYHRGEVLALARQYHKELKDLS